MYHHVSRIRPGGDLDNASGGKLWSNPPKPSSRSALDLHCFVWANLDLHAGLARSSNPSYDCQLAPRYGGSRDQYLCVGISTPCGHTDSCDSQDGADEPCEHGRLSLVRPVIIRNFVARNKKATTQDRNVCGKLIKLPRRERDDGAGLISKLCLLDQRMQSLDRSLPVLHRDKQIDRMRRQHITVGDNPVMSENLQCPERQFRRNAAEAGETHRA